MDEGRLAVAEALHFMRAINFSLEHALPVTDFGYQDELLDRCAALFGDDIVYRPCVRTLATMQRFEEGHSVHRCPADFSAQLPSVIHDATFYSECSLFDRRINQYLVPLLMLFSTFGNVGCLLVYRLAYFDGSSSVNFLRTKALCNLFFVLLRFMEVIHSYTERVWPDFEELFWRTRPTLITLSNMCGMLSTWMTLLVTVETVVCVLRPFTFRRICTPRHTAFLLSIATLLSATVNLVFLSTQSVHSMVTLQEVDATENGESESHCWYAARIFLQTLTPYAWVQFAARIYYWLQIVLSIILPNSTMLACTLILVKRFATKKDLGEGFSQRRRCVIRITAATAIAHLSLEGPALVSFTAVALNGSLVTDHSLAVCMVNHVNNTLSLLNATIPFFLYWAANEQFRHMADTYARALFASDAERKKSLMSLTGMRRHRARALTDITTTAGMVTSAGMVTAGGLTTDRSAVDQPLLRTPSLAPRQQQISPEDGSISPARL